MQVCRLSEAYRLFLLSFFAGAVGTETAAGRVSASC